MDMKAHFWEHLALIMVLFIVLVSVLIYTQETVVGGVAKGSWCQDSDSGLTYKEKGIVQDSLGGSFIDSCKSAKMLSEGFCSRNKLTIKEYPCACLDGTCLLENSGRKRLFG